MAAEANVSWTWIVQQLRDAGAAFNTATQRWADQVTGPPCCQARTGVTPGGIPITWHTDDCPGLEQRLAAAVLAAPTETEHEMERLAEQIAALARAHTELLGGLRRLVSQWSARAYKPRGRLGSEAYRLGEANAYATASAQLAEELNTNRPASASWCTAAARGVRVGDEAPNLRCSLPPGHPGPHRTWGGAMFEARE